VIFGSSGRNNTFQPQEEFRLTPWISIHIAGIDLSINKAVLYLFLAASLTCFAMIYIARRMQDRPNNVQTAAELAFDLTRNNITRATSATRRGGEVVRVHRDAVLLHLVLEPPRLPAAADEHARDDQHLRRGGPLARDLRGPRRTSRSRWS